MAPRRRRENVEKQAEARFMYRTTPDVAEVLRRLAFERNVSQNRLMDDTLRMMIIRAVDRTDPMFATARLGLPFPETPVEPYDGYFRSLGFGPYTDPTHSHLSAAIESAEDAEFLGLSQPDAEPYG